METKFICDLCGKEKTGEKHPVYDENYNLQKGIYQCTECLCFDKSDTCKCDNCSKIYYEPYPKYEFGEYNLCNDCKNDPNIILE